jgi:prephenate dehydrogenase
MFNTIALFGLGLLGGSICKGLKKNSPGTRIAAYGRYPERLEQALGSRLVDSVAGFDRISLSGVDLAVVSTPVDSSIEIIKRILSAPDLGPETVVIDVGSVKDRIIRSVEHLGRAGQFIGCHPMAGSEKMGYEHSREDLFDGASVIITPHRQNRDEDVLAVRRFWESLRARTIVAAPETHDLIVTYTSHLPHLVASSLVRVFHEFCAAHGASADLDAFIGNGFRDTTRVSSGSPDMWRDIAVMNRQNILDAVDRMVAELGRLRKAISEPDAGARALHEYFTAAKKIRDGLK